MAHLHITAWLVAIILLFVVTSLYKKENNRTGKIIHMILRLDYIIVLISGVLLLFEYDTFGSYLGEIIVKVIAGLWTIVSIEMITVRSAKGEAAKGWWIQFVIAALIAILLGFTRLPMGVLP